MKWVRLIVPPTRPTRALVPRRPGHLLTTRRATVAFGCCLSGPDVSGRRLASRPDALSQDPCIYLDRRSWREPAGPKSQPARKKAPPCSRYSPPKHKLLLAPD